jgi:hypothetical protein
LSAKNRDDKTGGGNIFAKINSAAASQREANIFPVCALFSQQKFQCFDYFYLMWIDKSSFRMSSDGFVAIGAIIQRHLTFGTAAGTDSPAV